MIHVTRDGEKVKVLLGKDPEASGVAWVLVSPEEAKQAAEELRHMADLTERLNEEGPSPAYDIVNIEEID